MAGETWSINEMSDSSILGHPRLRIEFAAAAPLSEDTRSASADLDAKCLEFTRGSEACRHFERLQAYTSRSRAELADVEAKADAFRGERRKLLENAANVEQTEKKIQAADSLRGVLKTRLDDMGPILDAAKQEFKAEAISALNSAETVLSQETARELEQAKLRLAEKAGPEITQILNLMYRLDQIGRLKSSRWDRLKNS